jgi:hemolysin activation/secretion protein
VTEGKLERVRVRGERYFSGRQIRAALPALVPGDTPDLPALQRELTALNARSADRTVTPVLRAGAAPGTVDMDLAVKDRLPLHGYIEGDDQHTADTTPNRATISLSYDNLWQRQDSVSVQYQTAPADTRNASVEIAGYVAHVGSGGGLASFSYIHTSSNVLALGTLGVLGKGSIYGAHWLEPIVNTEALSQSFNLGVDYKDVNTEVFPNSTAGSPAAAVTAPVHYLNWSASYSQAWRAAAYQVDGTLGVGLGIRDLVNTTAEFQSARAGGAPDYFYLRFSGSAIRALPLGAAVLARLTAQWSASPLVNNEQFSLGGVETVRGYLEAESLGDSGVAGTLELHSPPLGPHFGSTLGRIYAFGFVDAGVATLLDPLPSQDYHLRLWSTGAGLRLENGTGFAGFVDWAVPEVTGTRTRAREPRVEFSARYGF